MYLYACVLLGTNRIVRAVATLESLHCVNPVDTLLEDEYRLQPPDGLLRLVMSDVVVTPPTLLAAGDYKQGGKYISRLVSGRPESLAAFTGGERLNVVIVPLLQLQRFLRDSLDFIVIDKGFALEAGLTLCIQESPQPLVQVMPVTQTAVEDDDDSEADGERVKRPWPVELVFEVVALMPLLRTPKVVVDDEFCPPLPSERTLRRWSVTLDLLAMLFRRWQHEQGHFRSTTGYLSCDASPQWGYDYLIMKLAVARINLPDDGCPTGTCDPLGYVDIEQHMQPPATVGHGKTTTAYKLTRLVRSTEIEVPEQCLDHHRCSIRSCFSDQGGGERNMWAAPNFLGKGVDVESVLLAQNSGGSSEIDYMFPRAWEHPGILHIHFNALQTALMRLREWAALESAFRGFFRFLSKKPLRDQFRNIFFKQGDDEADAVLARFSGGCFNWRWEKLEGLLTLLSDIVPVLLARWRCGE